MPLPEDLHLAYQTYFTHGDARDSGGDEGHAPTGLRGILRSLRDKALHLRRLGEDIESLALLTLGHARPGRVLELGAGDGLRLRRLRERGWQVEGQDVDPRAHVFRLADEGVKVHLGVLETLDLPAAAYDAIVMSHVIEHLPDPVGTLRTCARLLRPGGKLVAVTPNSASFGSRRYGADWMALDPPRHLHLFNPRNLRDTARRAGYAHAEVSTTGANGAGVALGSRFIRDTGRYQMGGLSRRTSESAVIVLIQAFEALVPSLGEECILSAWTDP